MRVLITGGAGFVGSHLADLLTAEGHRVRILDNLEPQVHGQAADWPAYLPSGVERSRGSICDPETANAAIQDVDVIFHEAAVVGVGQSMYQIRHYANVNIVGTATLLDALVNTRHHVRKVVVAASMSSYGEGLYVCEHGPVRPPLRTEEQMRRGDWELSCPSCGRPVTPTGITESAELNCTSVYATTKKVQEELVLMVCKAYGIPAVALRYFNIYGPRQSLNNPYTGVAAIFLSQLKNGEAPLVFEDGLQTRDFVSVHDVARANVLALTSDGADGEVLNVGTGRPTSVARVGELLADALGLNIQPRIVGRFRKGDVRHCYADAGNIQRLLGWRPEINLAAGIDELVAWSASVEAADHVALATQELADRGLLV